MQKVYYISTGRKSVMHTLWKYCKPEAGENLAFRGKHTFIKNLPIDVNIAVEEAKRYAKEAKGIFEGVNDSPQGIRSNSFEFAGVHFKRKQMKSGLKYIGKATDEFFKLWREKKEELRSQGYSVSKYKEIWFVFYNRMDYKKSGGKSK